MLFQGSINNNILSDKLMGHRIEYNIVSVLIEVKWGDGFKGRGG